MPLDDRRAVDAMWERSVRAALGLAQVRRAEGVGERGWRVADEERGLEGAASGETGDVPSAVRGVLGVGELSLEALGRGVERALAALRLPDLVEERLDGLRLPGDEAERSRAFTLPAPPRASSAGSLGRGAAGRTPRRSRCRRGTRAPQRRAQA